MTDLPSSSDVSGKSKTMRDWKRKKKGKQLKLKNTTGLWPVNKEVKGKFVRREGNVMQKKRMFREARQAI